MNNMVIRRNASSAGSFATCPLVGPSHQGEHPTCLMCQIAGHGWGLSIVEMDGPVPKVASVQYTKEDIKHGDSGMNRTGSEPVSRISILTALIRECCGAYDQPVRFGTWLPLVARFTQLLSWEDKMLAFDRAGIYHGWDHKEYNILCVLMGV